MEDRNRRRQAGRMRRRTVGLGAIVVGALAVFLLVPLESVRTPCIQVGKTVCIGSPVPLVESLGCLSVGVGADYAPTDFYFVGSAAQYHLGCIPVGTPPA
jgi:hypothetical protein